MRLKCLMCVCGVWCSVSDAFDMFGVWCSVFYVFHVCGLWCSVFDVFDVCLWCVV